MNVLVYKEQSNKLEFEKHMAGVLYFFILEVFILQIERYCWRRWSSTTAYRLKKGRNISRQSFTMHFF